MEQVHTKLQFGLVQETDETKLIEKLVLQ